MTVYRVGRAGAVVFSPDGAPLIRLDPGWFVVPGAEKRMPEPSDTRVEILEERIRRHKNPPARPASEAPP